MNNIKIGAEQLLDMAMFAAGVEKMPEVEVKRLLVETYERLIRLDAQYRQMIGEAWGVK